MCARETVFDKMSDPPRARPRVVTMAARKPPVELSGVRVVRDLDEDADVSYLEQDGFEERLADYQSGRLHLVELWVEANVLLQEGVEALVRSPGVGGIESDTTEEELDALISEEWTSLRGALKRMGVSTEQLPLEVEPEWVEWRS